MADENKTAYASREWHTGDVITADALNKIENEMEYVSEEVTNAVTGTINDQKLNDTLARKLDSVVKYFPNTPNPDTDLKYVRMYAQPSTEGAIIVPTEEEYLRFKQNFVQPFTNKDYVAGNYVEYEDEIYKVKAAIAKNNSAADDAAAWAAILAQNPSPVGKINPMEELNNLINVYTNDSQLTSEQNRIWIQQLGESVEVPSYEEFTSLSGSVDDLKSAVINNDVANTVEYSFGYINGSGNIASSTTHYISAMIPVEAGESYNYYGYEAGNIFVIGFYETSESTTALTAVSIGAPQTIKSIDFEVPSGAKFMRVSYHKDHGKPIIYKRTTQTMLWTSLEQNLSYPISGFIFYNDGSVVSNNAFHCTDFIEIRGTILKMQMPFYSQASIAFYDSTKMYIANSSVRNTSSSAQTGDSRIYTVKIPATAKYFRTSKADALSNTYFSGAIAADDSEAIRDLKNETGLSNEILCPSKLYVAQDMPVYYYPLQMALNSKKFEMPTVLYQESFTSANKWNRQNQKDYAYMTYNSSGDMSLTMQINHVKNDNTVEEIVNKNVSIISYAKPTSKTAKVLVIGDSYFNYPWITDTTQGSVGEGIMSQIDALASADGNTVQFIGTKLEYTTQGGTAYYGEAYGGWTENNFLSSSSPFYINGQIDFGAYFTANGTPDIVLFFLGMNYGTGSGINTMITNIKAASANTKIVVCTVPPWPKYWVAIPDDNYAKEMRRQNQNKNYLTLFDDRTNDGIIVCPIHMTFERTFHYIHSNTKAATYPDEYTSYFTQCYNNHPSTNGAKTIAYVVYDYLLYFMKDM